MEVKLWELAAGLGAGTFIAQMAYSLIREKFTSFKFKPIGTVMSATIATLMVLSFTAIAVYAIHTAGHMSDSAVKADVPAKLQEPVKFPAPNKPDAKERMCDLLRRALIETAPFHLAATGAKVTAYTAANARAFDEMVAESAVLRNAALEHVLSEFSGVARTYSQLADDKARDAYKDKIIEWRSKLDTFAKNWFAQNPDCIAGLDRYTDGTITIYVGQEDKAKRGTLRLKLIDANGSVVFDSGVIGKGENWLRNQVGKTVSFKLNRDIPVGSLRLQVSIGDAEGGNNNWDGRFELNCNTLAGRTLTADTQSYFRFDTDNGHDVPNQSVSQASFNLNPGPN